MTKTDNHPPKNKTASPIDVRQDHEACNHDTLGRCPSLSELQPLSVVDGQPDVEIWHPTKSQRAGLIKLNRLAEVFAKVGESKFAGFNPLCQRVLTIGTSGAGKTALVNRFASERHAPILSLDCGSWLVAGAASKPPTLRLVRDFVRSYARGSGLCGIIFADELCKLVPAGRELSQNSWSLSVFGEAIALLSADSRLLGHDWSKTDIHRLRNHFMIIGGGAFQAALKEVQAADHKGELGFAAGSQVKATHASAIGQFLPEEILSRFSSDVIILDAPSRKDFEEAILRIHSQLGIPRLIPLAELVDEAVAGLGGIRWIENYLFRLLCEHPYAVRNRHTIPDGEPQTEHGPRIYDLPLDVPQCQRDANEVATKLQTNLALVYSRLQCIADAGQGLPAGGVLCNPQFYDILCDAITACRLTDRISDDKANDPLGLWRDVAWQTLGESSPFLQTHHLTKLWAEAWSLAGGLIDHRQKLLQAIQRGQLG